METNWVFQEPIDFEHKQYVLLNYLQKTDKELSNFKLYPNFQLLSLHLANINLIIQKGQYLTLSRQIKEKDDEILISDLVPKEIIRGTEDEVNELFKICVFSSQKLQEYFEQAKAIWEIVNDTVSLDILSNSKNIKSKEGLFVIENKDKTYLYEFIIKEIKKNSPDLKCFVKKINEIENFNLTTELFKNKKTLIKDLSNPEKYKNLVVFKVNHSQNFPFNETLLPIVKRKINNLIAQTKILSEKNLTKNLQ
jgi:hypothetical protein